MHLFYSKDAFEIEKADIIIIPGTKNTLNDLHFLRKQNIVQVILSHYEKGKKVIGICGGYQMLGQLIKDPHHVESDMNELSGLGLLPITTTLTKEKKTVQQEFLFKNKKAICTGYEIHMGVTKGVKSSPLLKTKDGRTEGYVLDNNCWGSYMHGILDNAVVIDDLLGSVSKNSPISYQEFKEKNYDLLADLLRDSLDMEYMYSQSKKQDD
ncbi:cobyric acid synthase [Aquimarina agarilytica]|uniref:hypothetical protein n=1 Tax=Aquimarina agarilytica TaxID=1087449 RepID=UPI00031CDE02|nr:hypothetical protein [Aquimarina agarilytica]